MNWTAVVFLFFLCVLVLLPWFKKKLSLHMVLREQWFLNWTEQQLFYIFIVFCVCVINS